MRIRRIPALLSVAMLAVASLSGPMFARSKGLEKRVDVKLAHELQVGNQLLPAGRYQVQHIEEADGHYVVFRSRRGQVVARQLCELRPLKEKIRYVSVYSQENSSGVRVLTELRLNGQSVAHVFK